MQKSSFEDRFLSKLSKIDRQEIEGFLGHLVREKHFLEIVFNAMLDGIVVLRPNLEVMYTNNAAIDLLGINPKRKIVGERIAALVPIHGFADLVARFALHRQRVINAEMETATIPPRLLTITVIPLEADTNHTTGSVILIVHDATEVRRAAEEKRRAERATTLATLTAGLAHEIKNPLNSLQIHAQLLQRALREPAPRGRKADKTRLLQSSEIIVEEIQRLSRVVDTFLTAVRPTRPLMERTDINRLVERVVATMKPEAESRGVRLALAMDHDIPLVDVDPNQVTQAILNLVKNAIEALDAEQEGTRAAAEDLQQKPKNWNSRVEVRTELSTGEYRIRVADNGPGIPETDLKKIFEPYFTTKFSGTGLGLAIVSRIVEEHSGRMDVHSKPGAGTVITLSFPLEDRPVRLLEEE